MRGKGRLSEADVDAGLREIRLALLEADVNVAVARDLLNRVKVRAVGAEVTKSLTPGQQVVKIVNEELVATLGGEPARLTMAPHPPDGDPPWSGCRAREDHIGGQARPSPGPARESSRCWWRPT